MDQLPDFNEDEVEVEDQSQHLPIVQLDTMRKSNVDEQSEIFLSKCVKKVRFSDEVRLISCDDSEMNGGNEFEFGFKLDDETASSHASNEVIDSLPLNLCVISSNELQQIEHADKDTNMENLMRCDEKNDFDAKDNGADMIELSSDMNYLSLDSRFETEKPSLNAESFHVNAIGKNDSHTCNISDYNKDDSSYISNKDTTSKVLSSKRFKCKTVNKKQSEKINAILKKDHNYSNAKELKSTVFKAWCTVKNMSPELTDEKHSKKVNVRNDNSVASKSAYAVWKRSKIETVKSNTSKKITSSDERKNISNDDDFEKEMAFKSWKKNKDEIFKQKVIEQRRNEYKRTVAFHLKESEKKKNAEAAFCLWKTHKLEDHKLERKRKDWILQKEQEENTKKILRERNALKMYFLWLESKRPVKTNSFCCMEEKPPWYPP